MKMSLEERLIKKTYYQAVIPKDKSGHPVQLLGELFCEEQKKEIPDSSYIRYSQGEVYFHNKDYEAAIYKWNNVHNELETWARKNSGDAYVKLELYTTAEEIYQSIETDSLLLQTEVLLELFHLYEKQQQLQKADQVIKKLVDLNPDYQNVTLLARNFYEEHGDWQSAIDLAIREGQRSEQAHWYEVLKMYIHKGYTKSLEPAYFTSSLDVAYKLAPDLLEQLVLALWKNYRNEESYFTWIIELNQFFLTKVIMDDSISFRELPGMYKEIYQELIDGQYTIKQLSELLADMLTVWCKLSDQKQAILPAAAIFAWNEMIPSRFSQDVIRHAERVIFSAENNVSVLKKSKNLRRKVLAWTEKNKLEVSHILKYLGEEVLDTSSQHVGVLSFAQEEKSNLMNSLLNEIFLLNEGQSSILTIYKYGAKLGLTEMKPSSIKEINETEEYMNVLNYQTNEEVVVEVKSPNAILKTRGLSFVDLPVRRLAQSRLDNMDKYLTFLDSLLIIFDKELTDGQKELIQRLEKKYPDLPIQFVATGTEKLNSNDKNLIPKGKVFFFAEQNRHELFTLLKSQWNEKQYSNLRLRKFLYFINKITEGLLEQRRKKESDLAETISFNEDLFNRVNGAIHQLEDLRNEKIEMIYHSFLMLKEETKKEIYDQLPVILKELANTVTEDRDFSKIHIELNKEMNDKIQEFMNTKILPRFQERCRDWLLLSENELVDGKRFLEEISAGFNKMMGENRLEFTCDPKLLGDWKRDIDRLASRAQVKNENIMLRYTPSQIILKSAGKLLNSIVKNKAMIAKQYQNFVQSNSYTDVAASVAEHFLLPFALVEQGIEGDVGLYFKDSFRILKEFADETKNYTIAKKVELEKLKENPESFHDPLIIFQIQVMQYKYILDSEEAKETVK